MDIINQKHFKFLETIEKRPRTLTEISVQTENQTASTQKIFNILLRNGLVDSIKQGRERLVVINENGVYFMSIARRILKHRARRSN